MGLFPEKDEDDLQNISLRSFEGPPYPESSITRLPLTDEEIAATTAQDSKNKYLLECHIPPIVWTRVQFGYRVQGMTNRHYFDVSNLIKDYMPTDPLLRIIKDQQDIDDYLKAVFSWFPKTQSLVAVKEGSKEIAGVLIGRLVVEPGAFEILSQTKFALEKDRYAHLKTCGGPDSKDADKKKTKMSVTGKPTKRASKVSRRSSKHDGGGGSRKSMKGGGSRKSMGAKGGSRKSMGAKGGSRKSMGAKGGSRKSMGAGQRKSMGAKGAGQRKSMGAGQRKSMGSKGGGSRKSMGAPRKSMAAKGSGKRTIKGRATLGKGEWKVSRPFDIVPEEEKPILQARVFDDEDIECSNKRLQLVHSFRRKLAGKFNVWKMVSQKIYYRIYLVAVSPRYRRMEVDTALFESLKHMCHAFNVLSIAGILTRYDSQNAFYKSGGLMIYEVLYKNYPLFEDRETKSYEYDRSAAVMYMDLRTVMPSPPPEPDPQKPPQSSKTK